MKKFFTFLFIVVFSTSWAQGIPDDEFFTNQWYLNMPGNENTRADIRIIEAWGITKGSSSIKIAAIDEDAYPDVLHDDLLGRITGGGGIINNHATQVAGIMIANSNNGEGIAGINWNSHLDSYFYNIQQGEQVAAEQLAQKIYQASSDGNRIINMSVGFLTRYNVLGIACAQNYKNNKILVTSIGNNLGSQYGYPARFYSTISVGASTKFNEKAGYSSTGTHINLLAPGGSGQGFLDEYNIITTSNSTYEYTSGTSFA